MQYRLASHRILRGNGYTCYNQWEGSMKIIGSYNVHKRITLLKNGWRCSVTFTVTPFLLNDILCICITCMSLRKGREIETFFARSWWIAMIMLFDTKINILRLPSYGIHISQLVRFARCCTSVLDFHSKNLQITWKLLILGYRYHKLRKTFGKFFRSYSELLSKFGDISFQEYLSKGISSTVI